MTCAATHNPQQQHGEHDSEERASASKSSRAWLFAIHTEEK
jgi:hypothetical protein